MPQNLSLKELNNMLLKYIDEVRYNDSRSQVGDQVTMTVDRAEVEALRLKYEEMLREWRTKYEQSERELSEARLGQGKMEDLQRELTFLRSELEKANRSRDQERIRASELDTKLRSVEQELMNRITILETELANEKGRSKVDVSQVDSRLKGEYEAQLKKELKALRREYERYMKHSKEEFMRTYNQKVLLSIVISFITVYPSWLISSGLWPTRRVTTAGPR